MKAKMDKDVYIIAQEFNDNYIDKSELDKGMRPIDIALLLKKFNEHADPHAPVGLGRTKSKTIEEVDLIAEKTSNLLQSHSQLSHYNSGKKLAEHLLPNIEYSLNDLVEPLKIKIQSLSKGSGIIIPGGYISYDGNGHAMIYEIIKKEENSFELIIYNTGDGLNYHEKASPTLSTGYKEKFNYKAVYDLNQNQLDNFLTNAIRCQIFDEKEFLKLKHDFDPEQNPAPSVPFNYAENIYKNIGVSPKKTPEEEKDDPSLYVSPQYAGTCLVSSFNVLMREGARTEGSKDKTAYNKVKFNFRKNLLDDFFKQYIDPFASPSEEGQPLSSMEYEDEDDYPSFMRSRRSPPPEKPIWDEKNIEQLSIAIDNFIGFVNKEIKRLGNQRFEEEYGELKSLYEDLKSKQEKLSKLVVTWHPSYIPSISSNQLTISNSRSATDEYLTYQPDKYPTLEINQDTLTQLKSAIASKQIDLVTNELNKLFLREVNYPQNQLHEILDLINEMLVDTRFNVVSGISIDNDSLYEKKKFDQINKLLDHYVFIVNSVFGGKPPAKFCVTYNKIISDIVIHFQKDLRGQMLQSIQENLFSLKGKDPVMAIPIADLNWLQGTVCKKFPESSEVDRTEESTSRLYKKIIQVFKISPRAQQESLYNTIEDWLVPDSPIFIFLNRYCPISEQHDLRDAYRNDEKAINAQIFFRSLRYFSEQTADKPDSDIDYSFLPEDLKEKLIEIRNYYIKLGELSLLLNRLNLDQSCSKDHIPNNYLLNLPLKCLMSNEYDDISFLTQYPNIKKALYLNVYDQCKSIKPPSDTFGRVYPGYYYYGKISPSYSGRTFNWWSRSRGEPNAIERDGDSLELDDEKSLTKSDELPLRRLEYPHSVPKRAVFNLLSTFIGRDKDYLTKKAYQFYFERMLFTPQYISDFFDLENLASGENKETALTHLQQNLAFINEYLKSNLIYFSEQNNNINAYLFTLKMLTYINLYAKESVLKLYPEKKDAIECFNDNSIFNLHNFQLDPSKLYFSNVCKFIYDVSRADTELTSLVEGYKTLNQPNNQKYYDSLDVNLKEMLHSAYGKVALSTPLPIPPLSHSFSDILMRSSDYNDLFGQRKYVKSTVKDNGSYIEFELNHNKYRAIKKENSYKIQREFNGEWYQYLPENQQLELPKYMKGKRYHHWIKKSGNIDEFIITKDTDPNPVYVIKRTTTTNKVSYSSSNSSSSSRFRSAYESSPSYESDSDDDKYELTVTTCSYEVTNNENESILVNLEQQSISEPRFHTLTNQFKSFEPLDFIEFKIRKTDNVIEACLKRYDLTFQMGFDRKIMCKTFPDYTLKEIDSNKKTVLLVNEKDNPPSYKLITPKANYKPHDSSLSGIWKELTPETDSLDNIDYYFLDYDYEKKRVIANNTEQALFAAYFNLSKNNIPLAMDYMNQCNLYGGLVGAEAELNWVHAILQHLKQTPQEQRNSFYYIVARCRAIALVARYLQSGRKDLKVDSICESEETPLTVQASAEYNKYLHLINNVPIEFRLTSDEERAMFAMIGQAALGSSIAKRQIVLGQEDVARSGSTQKLDVEFSKEELEDWRAKEIENEIKRKEFLQAELESEGGNQSENELNKSREMWIRIYSNSIEKLKTMDQKQLTRIMTRSKLESIHENAHERGAFVALMTSILLNNIEESINGASIQTEKKEDIKKSLLIMENELIQLMQEHISIDKKFQILAHQTQTISIDSLIDHYYTETLSIYGLGKNDTAVIAQFIEDILKIKLGLRAMELYEEATHGQSSNPEYLTKLLQNLEPILRNKLFYDSKALKAELIFQVRHEKCLREEQRALLHAFKQDTEQGQSSLTQMIMGGGKTKMLLPILVQQHADGIILPVVVVPSALFSTNLADLNAATIKAFNQRGNAFIFSREDINNASDSAKILEYLHTTIIDRNYLVTTSESMQSLQLKYYEILSNKPDEKEIDACQDWKENLNNIQKILNIFKTKSHAFIDEVDTVFNIRKKFQYASGDQEHYDSRLTELGRSMYSYLLSQTLLGNSLVELINSSQILPKQILKAELLRLLTDSGSPLSKIIGEKYDRVKQAILAWLENPTRTSLTALIADLDLSDIQDIEKTLAFYALQINTILPMTLGKKHNQHYGFPFASSTPKLSDRLIAIPYRSAKDPSHGSRFANLIEEMNFTYQSGLCNPISHDICNEFIEQYHLMALRARIFNPLEYKKIIEFLKEFDCTDGDITLDAINIEDEEQVDKLISNMSRNMNFRLYCVKHYGLDEQLQDKQILTASTIDHADLYHRCYGLTGTPWNIDTLHDKMTSVRHLDPTSDAKVESYLLQEEKSDLIVLAPIPSAKPIVNDLVESILSHCKGNTRAIIDVSGLFKDINNVDVARTIARHLAHQGEESTLKKIKYVLFFDEDNNLFALDTSNLDRQILLTNTDSKQIVRTLNCSLDECFTYYDQKHTTGIDITQDENAHAIMTIDEQTMKRDSFQGGMRMRKLSEKQSITIAISNLFNERLKRLNANPNIKTVLEFNEKYQAHVLQADEQRALIAKQDAVLARFLYQIASCEGIDYGS